jgi:hypothetical protein
MAPYNKIQTIKGTTRKGSTTVNGGKGIEKEKGHEANWLLSRQTGKPHEPSKCILPEYGVS